MLILGSSFLQERIWYWLCAAQFIKKRMGMLITGDQMLSEPPMLPLFTLILDSGFPSTCGAGSRYQREEGQWLQSKAAPAGSLYHTVVFFGVNGKLCQNHRMQRQIVPSLAFFKPGRLDPQDAWAWSYFCGNQNAESRVFSSCQNQSERFHSPLKSLHYRPGILSDSICNPTWFLK